MNFNFVDNFPLLFTINGWFDSKCFTQRSLNLTVETKHDILYKDFRANTIGMFSRITQYK